MRFIVIICTLIFLFSCKDIFTTNMFSEFQTDPSEMSDEQLWDYASDVTDPEELEEVELLLAENRIVLSEDDLDDPVLVAKYVDQTTVLMEINMDQADIAGLLLDLSSGGDDSLSELTDDTDRLDDMSDASVYAVEIFELDPGSLSETQLVVGSLGLMSEIMADDESSTALESVTDYETDTLSEAGFTPDEIEDIQTANAMMDLARVGMDPNMSESLEGLPF